MSFTRAILYPYSLGSKSAKLLAATLKTKCVRVNGTYVPRASHLIVNWGNSRVPSWITPAVLRGQILNKPQYVTIASHKIKTFEQLELSLKEALPDWTTNVVTATGWLKSPKYAGLLSAVVVRKLTQANSGRGIELITKVDEITKAPLYTRYKPKQSEFRIHVSSKFGIIDSQQKKKRNDVEADKFNSYIRSHDNGWVFCREGIEVPQVVLDTAQSAIAALHLDFGAVDIGYHDKYGVTLYEVNTAPGIEGQTLSNYVALFQKHLDDN